MKNRHGFIIQAAEGHPTPSSNHLLSPSLGVMYPLCPHAPSFLYSWQQCCTVLEPDMSLVSAAELNDIFSCFRFSKQALLNRCWHPKPSVVFNVLLSARITSAFLSNISDCDETFNYWEPVSCSIYCSL